MSFVIFAGAGISIAPPASLPSWFALNDAILEALWDRMERYDLSKRIRQTVTAHIKASRERHAFPPDYQAQVMVERAGMKYFELLSAVDSDHCNAFHNLAAVGARAGLVKAVVTTNFDRNFERAFAVAGAACRTFASEADFNAFDARPPDEIPVIKIHGCCTLPESMVDTRKQRLKGRAKSLESALASLLGAHPFIFAGFSGADFDDNANYLGIRDASAIAKGFTFLHQPGTTVRDSISALMKAYGPDKARSLEMDATAFLKGQLNAAGIACPDHTQPSGAGRTIAERLREKIEALDPMDAANMMFALAEANGDEPAARYLYDRVWKERAHMDYNPDSFDRFLLNHSRSFAFNFQDRAERASAIDISVVQFASDEVPGELPDQMASPAKANLKHVRNTSPETTSLIGLVQTYYANPILFKNFPDSLTSSFKRSPTITELADIVYHYSFYALVYGAPEGAGYLTRMISKMEEDCDEPRLSQLLSRRAMISFRDSNAAVREAAAKDAAKARRLARKYNEPHLLALSALALAIEARKRGDYAQALGLIQEAETRFSELNRIPQYVEAILEHLKILLVACRNPVADQTTLADQLRDLESVGNRLVINRIPVFEPEFCYLMGMILGNYTDLARERILEWFADAVGLSDQYGMNSQNAYFRETCAQLGIIEQVDGMIAKSQAIVGTGT